MSKPIVALVVDENGSVSVAASGHVTVVWIQSSCPHDRVVEVLTRKPRQQLEALLGDSSTWGNTEDEKQREVENMIAKLWGMTKEARH